MEIIWALLRKILRIHKFEANKKEVIIMAEKKEFVEPELIKYAEKLDEVTMQPLGSPPTDTG